MEQPDPGAARSEDTIDVLVVEPTDPAATITDQSLHFRLPHLADAATPRSLAPEALGQVVAEVARQVDAVMAHVDTVPQHVQLDVNFRGGDTQRHRRGAMGDEPERHPAGHPIPLVQGEAAAGRESASHHGVGWGPRHPEQPFAGIHAVDSAAAVRL